MPECVSADGPWNVTISGPGEIHLPNLPLNLVVFKCSANSRPTSQYQWFADSDQAAIGDGPVLNVLVVTPKVISYTCKAFNNVTQNSMSQNKTVTITGAAGHSLASPGVLLFMILAALAVPMLGN